MNVATINSLNFEYDEVIISDGNFYGKPIAFAMDFLKIAVVDLLMY